MASSPSANRGAGLESLLEYRHHLYRAAGVADIRKLPTDWHVVAKAGQGRAWLAFPARKSSVDYLGFLMDGTGRHVAVEAKETRERRWPLAHLPGHQRAYLAAVCRAGGIAGVVIWWTALSELWAVPWSGVERLIRSGKASLAHEPGSPWRVGLDADYLPVLLAGGGGAR